MKDTSKKLLKSILIQKGYDLNNEDVALAIDIYCKANNVNKIEFMIKVRDIRKKIYDRKWTEGTMQLFHNLHYVYAESLLPQTL